MKFAIDIGHNCKPFDIGAKGLVKSESTLTLEVGTLVMSKLKAKGHDVVDCLPSSATSVRHSLQQRVNTANKAQVDLFVSIHFNAFNNQAHGSEVFAVSTVGKSYGYFVLQEICKLGYSNRGVKSTPKHFVIKYTTMPAILIECCFCDNASDMELYNTEAMANAIVEGLIKAYEISLIQPSLVIEP